MDKEAIVKEFREKFQNPYPENIFIEPTKEEFEKAHEVLKREVGIPLDKLSGSMGRQVFKYLVRDFESFLLTTLTEIERKQKREVLEARIEELDNFPHHIPMVEEMAYKENRIAELQKELGEETQ